MLPETLTPMSSGFLLCSLLAMLGSCTPGHDGAGGNEDLSPAADSPSCPGGEDPDPETELCGREVGPCEQPWELPRPDGTCVPVGPRACPRAWDHDSGAACLPGELLPCPEGFSEVGDGAGCAPIFSACGDDEVPTIGGGCAPVGLPAATTPASVFAGCGSGELPLSDGACVAVGPRACAKLWDHDTDETCEPLDKRQCPDDWDEDPDGIGCRPSIPACGLGEIAKAEGECSAVIPPAGACPPGPFPAAPAGAATVLHVQVGSPCVEGCGSAEAPYPSLQTAADHAPAGSALLVAPGTYSGGISIDKPLTMVGLCPAGVTLSGLVDGDLGPLVSGATVRVVGAQEVILRGVRITSSGAALFVSGGTVAGETLEIDGSGGAAVVVDDGASLTLTDCWIHDTGPGDGDLGHGRGLWIDGGAKVDLDSCLIEDVRVAGVALDGFGTSLGIVDSVIRGTKTSDLGSFGYGLVASGTTEVALDGALIEGNHSTGVKLGSGATLAASETVIRGTAPDGFGGLGFGVWVSGAASATLDDCLLVDNSGAGIKVQDPAAHALLNRSVIRDTTSTGDDDYSWGAVVSAGGTLDLEGSLLQGNAGDGVLAFDPGTEVNLAGTLVRDNLASAAGTAGMGLSVHDGASLQVLASVLEGNQEAGINLAGTGTTCLVQGSVIRGTQPGPQGHSGSGVFALAGVDIHMSSSLVEGNQGQGIWLAGGATTATLEDVWIRDTHHLEKAAEGELKAALVVHEGAQAFLSGCRLTGNALVGVFTFGEDSFVEVVASEIEDNEVGPEDGPGAGIEVSKGATILVQESLVQNNTGSGISVYGAGSSAVVDRCAVVDTLSSPDGLSGEGLWVFQGGAAQVEDSLLARNAFTGLTTHAGGSTTVERSLLSENGHAGVLLYNPGTEALIEDSVIAESAPVDGIDGAGIIVDDGATAEVLRSQLTGQSLSAVGVGEGATARLEASTVMGTRPDAGWGCFGVVAGGGAVLELSRCLIQDNQNLSVFSAGEGTEVSLRGTIIRDTLPLTLDYVDFEMGVGAMAFNGGTLSGTDLFVDQSAGAGIQAFDEGVVILEASAVVGTAPGLALTPGPAGGTVAHTFGDGIFVGEASQLTLSDSVVRDNARTGCFFSNSGGDIQGTSITNNGSFGLALEQSDVDHTDDGNSILGNAEDLPAGVSSEVTDSPQGLPKPPAPAFGGD